MRANLLSSVKVVISCVAVNKIIRIQQVYAEDKNQKPCEQIAKKFFNTNNIGECLNFYERTKLEHTDLKLLSECVKQQPSIGCIRWGSNEVEKYEIADKEIVVEIEKQIKQNNKDYKNVPDFIYALLCLHVYDKKLHESKKTVQFSGNNNYNKFLKDWEVLEIIDDYQDNIQDLLLANPLLEPDRSWEKEIVEFWRQKPVMSEHKSGYYGVAYVNKERKEIVLTNKGTDVLNLDDLLTDLFGVIFGLRTPREEKAKEAIRKVIDYVNEGDYKGYSLCITGHSLGGWLAILGAYKVKDYAKIQKNPVVLRVVTFDNPGVYPVIERYNDVQSIDFSNPIIITYLSNPNIVNLINTHLAYRVYTVTRDNKKTIIDGHGIEYIISCFNPKTGYLEIKDPEVKGIYIYGWSKDERCIEFVSHTLNKDVLDESINGGLRADDYLEILSKKSKEEILSVKYITTEQLAEIRSSYEITEENDEIIGRKKYINAIGEKNVDEIRQWINRLIEMNKEAREQLLVWDVDNESNDKTFQHYKEIGEELYGSGKYNEALKAFDKALNVIEKDKASKSNEIEADLLNKKGIICRILGKYGEAHKSHELALEKTKDNILAVQLLNNIGIDHQFLGEYEEALKYHEKALHIKKQLKVSKSSIATSLNSIGMIYYELEEYEKALEYYKEALYIRQELNEKTVPNSLINIGLVYRKQGKLKDAMNQYEEAEKILKKLDKENSLEFSDLLNNIGSIYYDMKDYDKALECYDNAIKKKKEIKKNHPSIAKTLDHTGEIYQAQRRYEEALKEYKQAYDIRKERFNANYKENNIPESLVSVSSLYNAIGDDLKSLHLKIQAYNMLIKNFGKEHIKVQKLEKQILELKKQISGLEKYNLNLENNEENTSIDYNNLFDKEIFNIQHKIQMSILNKIQELVAKRQYKEINDYLTESYLKNSMGNEIKTSDIEIARMLVLEAMNLGLTYCEQTKQDYECIKEFKKSYPGIVKKVLQEHPEYFVTKKLKGMYINDSSEIKGQGIEDKLGGSYWLEYTNKGIDQLLKLRLEYIDTKAKTISLDYVWDGCIYTTDKIINDIRLNLKTVNKEDNVELLIPLNLYGVHWVGVAVKKGENNIVVSYMDSEQQEIPFLLKTKLEEKLPKFYEGYNISITEIKVEKQKFNNCGLEVIENFAYYLSENRIDDQETVLLVHSMLFEDFVSI